jgi:hypothetical protein
MDINAIFRQLRERWAGMSGQAADAAGPYRDLLREAEELIRQVERTPEEDFGTTQGGWSPRAEPGTRPRWNERHVAEAYGRGDEAAVDARYRAAALMRAAGGEYGGGSALGLRPRGTQRELLDLQEAMLKGRAAPPRSPDAADREVARAWAAASCSPSWPGSARG